MDEFEKKNNANLTPPPPPPHAQSFLMVRPLMENICYVDSCRNFFKMGNLGKSFLPSFTLF